MAPMDAIWIFLVWTYPLPATSWLPTIPLHPIEVLVVLATSVKKLSKMAGNSASYPFNSW